MSKPARQLLAEAMTEAEFQAAVVEMARAFGWLVMHTRPALSQSGRWMTPLQGDAGFPDLVLVRAPRVIFAELKSVKGSVDKAQRVWLDALAGCPGVESFVWKPTRYDEVELTLR